MQQAWDNVCQQMWFVQDFFFGHKMQQNYTDIFINSKYHGQNS